MMIEVLVFLTQVVTMTLLVISISNNTQDKPINKHLTYATIVSMIASYSVGIPYTITYNKPFTLFLFICVLVVAMKGIEQNLLLLNNNEQIPDIKLKYFSDIDPIKILDNGDWIDLRSATDVTLKKGEFKAIPLGIGMKLPNGYEAHVVPRSSTYKNFKVIQANHQAVIDNSYCGNDDQWFYPVIAMEDTKIKKNDRICQFRIVKKQPNVEFEVVEKLEDTNRGGFGSTGTK